jgi:molybdopterin synthase catalytic subunit
MTYITERPIPMAGIMGNVDEKCGAEVVFAGYVRNHNEGREVKKLHYECYQSMAEKQIENIVNRAKTLWRIQAVKVLHRVGQLNIGDIAIFISVSAAHRDEAFYACYWMIDTLKQEVPIWKKEMYSDSSEEWVHANHENRVTAW